MAMSGLDVNGLSQKVQYVNRVGVDPQGNPVYLDPKKVKKHPNSVMVLVLNPETPESLGIPPEIREEQLRRIEKILQEKGRINPNKDKIYYNPATGELDTWKPGIIDPNQKEKNDRIAAKLLLFGGLLSMIPIVIFRKPIISVVGKVLQAGKDLFMSAINTIKNLFK